MSVTLESCDKNLVATEVSVPASFVSLGLGLWPKLQSEKNAFQNLAKLRIHDKIEETQKFLHFHFVIVLKGNVVYNCGNLKILVLPRMFVESNETFFTTARLHSLKLSIHVSLTVSSSQAFYFHPCLRHTSVLSPPLLLTRTSQSKVILRPNSL